MRAPKLGIVDAAPACERIEALQKSPGDFELLTPREAAGFLRVSVSFLAKARMRGDGPRFRKLSRAVRYLKSDLAEWLKARGRTSTWEL